MTDRDPSLHILQHALGLDDYGRDSRGRIPADVEAPYRNRFVTGWGCDNFGLCMAHVEAGRMSKHGPSPMFGGGDSYCFCVTDAGLEFVRANSPRPPKMSRDKQRYLDWLKVSDATGERFGEWLKRKTRERRDASAC